MFYEDQTRHLPFNCSLLAGSNVGSFEHKSDIARSAQVHYSFLGQSFIHFVSLLTISGSLGLTKKNKNKNYEHSFEDSVEYEQSTKTVTKIHDFFRCKCFLSI